MDSTSGRGRRRPERLSSEKDASQGQWDGLAPDYVRSTAARRLRALGHPERLRIIETLARHPAHVAEIAAELDVAISTASRHLRVLNGAGIVECSRHGNQVLYVLSDREVTRMAVSAYRGAAVQARRLIAAVPPPPEDDEPTREKAER